MVRLTFANNFIRHGKRINEIIGRLPQCATYRKEFKLCLVLYIKIQSIVLRCSSHPWLYPTPPWLKALVFLAACPSQNVLCWFTCRISSTIILAKYILSLPEHIYLGSLLPLKVSNNWIPAVPQTFTAIKVIAFSSQIIHFPVLKSIIPALSPYFGHVTWCS